MPALKAAFKFLVRLGLLVIIGLLGAIIYLDLHGFPPFLRRVVEDQLRRRGISASFRAIRVDVLRGIVAQDAELADARAAQPTRAKIDELQIDWNWPRLIKGQNAIDGFRIANATVAVPTPPDEIGPGIFRAEEAYATVRFTDDGALVIEQLTGLYAGVQVRLSGQMRLRAATETPRDQPTEPSRFDIITKVLRELDGLRGPQAPQLDVNFDVDLGAPLDGKVSVRLLARDVTYRKVNVSRVAVDAAMRNGSIAIHECVLEVGRGALRLAGRYDLVAGGFDLTLDSDLDPNLLLPAMPAPVADVVRDLRVLDPPKIAVRYLFSQETGLLPVLRGRLELGRVEIRGVRFRSVQADFEQQGVVVKVTDAKVVMAEGRLVGRGQFNWDTSDFAYELDSTLDPTKLLPLMFPVPRQIVEPAWFEKPPHLVATVRGDFVDPDAFAYDATVTAGRCTYRGVALERVSAQLKLRQNKLAADHLVAQRTDGEVRGWVFANFDAHRVAFDLAVSSNPNELAPLLGPQAADVLRPYRFGPKTAGTVRGKVDFTDSSRTAWQAALTNENFGYWKLQTTQARADLTLTNNTLTIENFGADFYDGKLQGRASFQLTHAVPYRFEFTTDRVDIQPLLTDITGQPSESRGRLTGSAWLTGTGADLGTLAGAGKLNIEDGVLWEVPLFGILSRILNDIGPNLGTTKATRADCNFTIAEQAAKTDDLKVAAGAFTLSCAGKVGFDGKLDFRVKGQLLRNVPGLNILTWFFSNIFEYKIGGSLGDYSYRPVNLPKEFLPHGSSKDKDKPASVAP
jgi:hypothetical protein